MDLNVPVHSVEAEMAVIGCCILAPDRAVRIARGIVSDGDFYRPVHRYLFRTVCKLIDSGTTVDMLTLSEAIKGAGKLDSVGGIEYLIEVQEAAPSAHNVEYYARIVADLSMLRGLESAGREIIGLVRDEDARMEPMEKLAKAQNLIADCGRFGSTDFTDIEDVADAPDVQGIRTGIHGIDSRVSGGGLPRSQMTIFAARKKVGKTSGMIQLALKAAQDNKKVLYCTMADLTKAQIWGRMRQSLTGSEQRPTGGFHGEAWDEKIADFRRTSSLWIADTKDLGHIVEPLALKLESSHMDKGYDLVIVDYAQKLDSTHERDRVRSLERVSTTLSRMADRCGFALLVGSQLSSDGKTWYSQEFENDCGLEIVADRPDLSTDDAFLEIKFNRFGPVGTLPVMWDSKRLRFNEIARQ